MIAAGGQVASLCRQEKGTMGKENARANWLIHRDSGSPHAQAISGHRDTIAGLAEIIGLGAEDEQWRAWLRPFSSRVALADGSVVSSDELGVTTPLAAGQVFGAPNRVLMLWTGDLSWLGRLAVGWEKEKAYLEERGFHVREERIEKMRPTTEEDALELFAAGTEAKQLHGLFVTGHGNKYLFGWRNEMGLSYADIRERLRYRLGLVILNVCNGGWCHGEADGIEAGGRDLLSSSPGSRFHGVKHMLWPRVFFFGGHARRVKDVLTAGEQGTRT
jgi:hypothetical protein